MERQKKMQLENYLKGKAGGGGADLLEEKQ